MTPLELSLLLRVAELEAKNEEDAARGWRRDYEACADKDSEDGRQLAFEVAHAEGRACGWRGAVKLLTEAQKAQSVK